ncbi:WhiB family transcriptional regulator [Streptosporangium sp. CA-115845]|uniref:WhiB family transcriptional regulator n=1 Tax=Streptosporangium sp. CA-115845 TaxID=3240071 RepID=UPI003D8E07E3
MTATYWPPRQHDDIPERELDWQDLALCAETDPEAFFPEEGGPSPAKKICRSCEVRAECLEYALDNEIMFGIWGGISERSRRTLQRRRNLGVAA